MKNKYVIRGWKRIVAVNVFNIVAFILFQFAIYKTIIKLLYFAIFVFMVSFVMNTLFLKQIIKDKKNIKDTKAYRKMMVQFCIRFLVQLFFIIYGILLLAGYVKFS